MFLLGLTITTLASLFMVQPGFHLIRINANGHRIFSVGVSTGFCAHVANAQPAPERSISRRENRLSV